MSRLNPLPTPASVSDRSVVLEPDNLDATSHPRKRWLLTSAAIVCLLSGLGVIIVGKLQNRIQLPPCSTCQDDSPKYFEQPLFQTLCMFVAMACCLLVDRGDVVRRHYKGLPRGRGALEFSDPSLALDAIPRLAPWWWFALPSLCDFLGTTMINVAFTITYASTVQLLRNSIILVTACTTMLIMRRPLVVHEWLGIIVMTAGMFVASIDSLLHPEAATNSTRPSLGVILTLVGTVLNALVLTIEERILKHYYCSPMRAVGWCGVTGIGWYLLMLPVVHWTGYQDLSVTWAQITSTSLIPITSLIFMANSFLFNASGMFVTKLGSGLLKSLIYSCRGPLMWIFEIARGWQAFTIFGLIGAAGTYGGFLVYTNLIRPRPQPAYWRRPVGCGPCTADEI